MTVLAAPMTTGSRPAPFRVPIRFQGKDGLILPDQIRTTHCRRLVQRLGATRPATVKAALAVLREPFGEWAAFWLSSGSTGTK